MVGGRSLGCRTCKQRRVKCDQRLPVCSQCEKSRRHCPGPDSPFRYENTSVEQHARLTPAVVSARLDQDGVGNSRGDLSWIESVVFAGASTAHRPASPRQLMPLLESERLAVMLISTLESPTEVGCQLQQMGTHFRLLPVRLGRSRALDAIVSCFLYSFTALSTGRHRDQAVELSRYCAALTALRHELNDSALATESETLCASLLLAQYEILKPRNPGFFYATLAGGVSRIFQACGPNRAMSSEFEHALFSSQYPTIVTQCMLKGERCFLSDPQWKNVMRSPNRLDSPLNSSLWYSLATLADVSVQIGPPSDNPSSLYNNMLVQLYSIRSNIVVHSDFVTRSLSTPGVHTLCPSVYSGPYPVAAFRPQTELELMLPQRAIKQATFYHACVIVVNTILQNRLTESNLALSLQTSQSASFILSTMDFAKTMRPFGAWHMPFAGPLCYGALKDEVKKEACLRGMKDIFDGLGHMWTHETLTHTFHQFTRNVSQ